MQHGADTVISSGFIVDTALLCAAQPNQASAVDVLVAAGAKIDTKVSSDSRSPFHLAASTGSCDTFRALLRHKADVHLLDCRGQLPLALARKKLQEEAADLLLRPGADETSVDKYGQCVYQLVGRDVIDERKRQLGADEMDSMLRLLNCAPTDRV